MECVIDSSHSGCDGVSKILNNPLINIYVITVHIYILNILTEHFHNFLVMFSYWCFIVTCNLLFPIVVYMDNYSSAPIFVLGC